MKILVINAGSSSIKYRLFDLDRGAGLARGLVEKIGEAAGRIRHQTRDASGVERGAERQEKISDHRQGMDLIVNLLTGADAGVIRRASEIDAIGHRVVHGGETFHRPALIDDRVLEAIRQNVPLAPLHNPANLIGIEAARGKFPSTPQVAVFDTAFHHTLPPRAYVYGLPYEYYQRGGIRRYGFHGTSHQYVFGEAASVLGRPPAELNVITVHLGNGSSITAVQGGKSIDTSMGMTPLEGLLMGTRAGDLDPAIIPFLAERFGMSIVDIETMLNQQSGLRGICGENDMREVLAMRESGNRLAALAVDIYTHRIRKYIGAYFAVLGRVDALVFTAGVGENSPAIRAESCRGLECLGIVIDPEKNTDPGPGPAMIQHPDSRVKLMVIPANEELAIARQTMELVGGSKL